MPTTTASRPTWTPWMPRFAPGWPRSRTAASWSSTPAWGYFADTYGLTQVAIEYEGKEPGARALAALIDAARASGSPGGPGPAPVQPAARPSRWRRRSAGGWRRSTLCPPDYFGDPAAGRRPDRRARERNDGIMRQPRQPVIAVEDLGFSYGDAPVLEAVDLEIAAGEFVGSGRAQRRRQEHPAQADPGAAGAPDRAHPGARAAAARGASAPGLCASVPDLSAGLSRSRWSRWS